MLAKQGWRLLTDQNSLLARILKAKYYPNGSYLDASLGTNPSFTWRGILQVRNLIQEGLRWRVGSGDSISVLHDPWLPRDNDFYVSPDVAEMVEHMKVSDLKTADGVAWDEELIQGIFSDHDATAIMSIPIPTHSFPDRPRWHYDKKGKFTVKSAYHVACRLSSSPQQPHLLGIPWNIVWKLRVPPKVREFTWRALRNVLPTSGRLAQRGIPLPSNCCVCSEHEDLTHVLLRCNRAASTWEL